MTLEFRKHITRQMLRNEPDTLFVFGDNLARVGLGGQAREMRGEPNAVGIPTKRYPSNNQDSFFRDEQFDIWVFETGPDILRLLLHEDLIVWPEAGIGTGRARLETSSPRIYKALNRVLDILS